MRILLSSLCFLFLVGCASYPKKNGFFPSAPSSLTLVNPYFSNPVKDYVYKAKVVAFDKSFGGILIIKKMAEKHHRIVVTTEFGNTLFDFEFQNENFKINHILPEMDKKLLINVLKRDFLALISEKPKIANSYKKDNLTLAESVILSKKHYYLFENDILQSIVRSAQGKEKVTFRFSGINDNIVDKIQILHKNLKLEIVLIAF